MLLRTFELFLFVADLLGVLTWQSRAGDPGHISGLNGSDEWFVALADNTHHLHLVGLKKIQRKLGNLYVEDVGIMVWHGSPFDNSVELFLVFSETLRMWPRCCLGTSTESHQKASRSSASKWRSYLGKKKRQDCRPSRQNAQYGSAWWTYTASHSVFSPKPCDCCQNGGNNLSCKRCL